jgi:hypothetical protein
MMIGAMVAQQQPQQLLCLVVVVAVFHCCPPLLFIAGFSLNSGIEEEEGESCFVVAAL